MSERLGDFPVGASVIFPSGKRYTVEHQGDSGTVVRPEARVAKSVRDKETDKLIRFSSKAAPMTVSAGTMVTRG